MPDTGWLETDLYVKLYEDSMKYSIYITLQGLS